MDTKQVIVFRKDLLKGEHAIRKGKFAGQVAHASMASLLKLFNIERFEYKQLTAFSTVNQGNAEPGQFCTRYSVSFKDGSILGNWLGGIFTKIVVSVESETDLMALVKELERVNEQDGKCIPYALITDCGKTEFGGTPTVTCLGIGPHLSEEIDKITGNLPLL